MRYRPPPISCAVLDWTACRPARSRGSPQWRSASASSPATRPSRDRPPPPDGAPPPRRFVRCAWRAARAAHLAWPRLPCRARSASCPPPRSALDTVVAGAAPPPCRWPVGPSPEKRATNIIDLKTFQFSEKPFKICRHVRPSSSPQAHNTKLRGRNGLWATQETGHRSNYSDAVDDSEMGWPFFCRLQGAPPVHRCAVTRLTVLGRRPQAAGVPFSAGAVRRVSTPPSLLLAAVFITACSWSPLIMCFAGADLALANMLIVVSAPWRSLRRSLSSCLLLRRVAL
jgi:hypothetical protein